jgi:hypothetical protein
MSNKTFASPGVSSHPLTLLDRAREAYLDLRYSRHGWDWTRIKAHLRYRLRPILHPVRHYRTKRDLAALGRALSAGSYQPGGLVAGAPLEVVSLDAVMQNITYRGDT